MSKLPKGWVAYDAAPYGDNEKGLLPSFGAKKWFGDHYQDVVAPDEETLAVLCKQTDDERALLASASGE